jgi:hypothetical protein
MHDWAKFAGFGALLAITLVGSLLWAINYPLQQLEWTCASEQRVEQAGAVTYKLVRCRPDDALTNVKHAVESADVKPTDVLLVIFSLGLVMVGFLQVHWLKSTMEVTGVAADAADKSARAVIGIELPIIRITPDKIHSNATRINDDAIKVIYSVADITFANLGRTKAFPVEVRSGIYYGTDLPPTPQYTASDTFLPNLIFEPDLKATPRKRLADCSVEIREGDGDKIGKGQLGLWFYCCLIYDDFMQTRHEALFCWRWTNIGGGLDWRPDSTPAYNRKT